MDTSNSLLSRERDAFVEILAHRKCDETDVQVYWDPNSGFIRGRAWRDGANVPVSIYGLPKRTAAQSELALVRRYFAEVAMRVCGDRIDVWVKLLGGIGEPLKNERLKSILSGVADKRKNYEIELDRRFAIYEKWARGNDATNLCNARNKFLTLAKSGVEGVFIRAMNGLIYTLENDLCEPSTSKNLIRVCDELWRKQEILKEANTIEQEKLIRAFGLARAALKNHCRSGYVTKEEGMRFMESMARKPERLDEHSMAVGSKMASICEYKGPISAFACRENELREIGGKLPPITDVNEKTKIVLLTGLGGVGKTQLGRKFVADNCRNYNNVYAFDCHSIETLNRASRLLVGQLGKEWKNIPTEKIFEIIGDEWERKGSLLFFDNADDTEVLKFLYDKCKFPEYGAHILITSRKGGHYQKKGNVEVIRVGNFTNDDSITLLKKFIPENKYSGDDELKVLAEELENHPLALTLAGSYIKSYKEEGAEYYNTHKYLEGFQKEFSAFCAGSDVDFCDLIAVKGALEKSAESVRKICPKADDILSLLAYLNPEEISIDWIEFCLGDHSEDELNEIIEILCYEYSILIHDEDKNSVSIHRLLQQSIQRNLSFNKKEGEFIKKALGLMKKKFVFFDYRKPYTWKCINQECLLNVSSVIKHLGRSNLWLRVKLSKEENEILQEESSLVGKMAWYAYLQGDIFQAKKYYKKALKLVKRTFHYESCLETDWMLNELRMVLFLTLEEIESEKKHYEEFRWAYNYKKKPNYKKSHPAVVVQNEVLLGIVYNKLGEYKKASDSYKRALKVCDENRDLYNFITIGKIKNMQVLNYNDQSKYEKAKACIVDAESIVEKFSQSDSVDEDECRFLLVEIWNNLGVICRDFSQEGDSNKAKEYFKKAMETLRIYYGKHHPRIAVVQLNLAETQRKLGELKEAFSLAELALALLEKIVGGSHPQMVQALNVLGKICYDLKDFQESRKYHEHALAIIEATHHEVLFSDKGEAYIGLANAMKGKGELTHSLEYLEKARDSFSTVYRKKHPKMVECDHFIREIHQMWEENGGMQ